MQNDANDEKVRKTIYLNSELCQKIEAAAQADDRSFNVFVVRLLEKAVVS